VTYNGTPVSGAMVAFAPKAAGGKGRSATGISDDAGIFKIGTVIPGDGALPGDYDVTVRKTEIGPSPYANISSEMDEAKQAAKGSLKVPKPKELLPEKYASSKTSGLTVTVGDQGAKDLKFNLTD
jgi:hypothetical protein